ncbi:hypothetical protein LTR86_001810 [Recurvomyces mirabilis]|nr:hypothetical protein LTR86_001810 [Recurvomyces mirabilis]
MTSPAVTVRAHGDQNSTQLVGWTLESPGRGTLSLAFTCLATTALCTWVCIHPRIDQRERFRLPHKIVLFIKAFIAPELITVEAAQEWTQARRTVRQVRDMLGDDFQYIHAFYIGMFGIRYRTDCGTKILWPNQFIWLVEQGLFDWQDRQAWGLTRDTIKDKSNADATAKLFALLQSVWFVAQSIMRETHNLPLAPLESMTLGYIPLSVVTYIYWWLKPKNIETPSEIDLPHMTIEQRAEFDSMIITSSFDNEGQREQQSLWQIWYLTPRIFELEVKEKAAQKALTDYNEKRIAYLRHEGSCLHKGCKECKRLRPGTIKPKHEVVLSHWDPELYHSKLWPVTCLFGISFGALHLVSWNTTFPTAIEAWLWRGAAITSMVSMLLFMQFEKVVLCSPLLYLASRVVMLGGAIAAFRASDPRLYDTYVASTYWVHLI